MAHADFVHLHLHTEYSLLDGAASDTLMEKARALHSPSGHNRSWRSSMARLIFTSRPRKRDQADVGCESIVAPASRLEKKAGSGGQMTPIINRIVGQDETGYKNLVNSATAGPPRRHY